MTALTLGRSGFFALSVVLLCAGCTRSIRIVPDVNELAPTATTAKIDKRVGYFISAENREKQVVTPGGGGDSVGYTPYADLEVGLNQVLSNVFSHVSVIKDIKDRSFIRENNISLVFIPTIETTSSSRNSFFWPPTDFSVAIECVALNSNGEQIWKTAVKADGGLVAVNTLFKEVGLTGRLAGQNALKQLEAQLVKAEELRR